MFNIKLEEISSKMSFKALPVKMQQSKNQQGRGTLRPTTPCLRADRVKNRNLKNQT